jgi:hypothetical protein
MGLGTVLVTTAVLVSAAPARTNGPPDRLTRQGQVTWNFEALLHDTFGQRQPCARGPWAANFAAGRCSPLAVWSPYAYQFIGARGSAFHVTGRRFNPGYFGNYPTPVLVHGKTVACDASERTFLILIRNAANFALDCVKA